MSTPQFWKPCTEETTNHYKDWSGAWVDSEGKTILVDQPNGIHHHTVVNEKTAFQNGWVSYRYIKPFKEFSATWEPQVSERALKVLAEFMKDTPDFGVYLFSTIKGNEMFHVKREAIRYVMTWLQS